MGKQEQRMQNTKRIILSVRCCDDYTVTRQVEDPELATVRGFASRSRCD